MVITTCIRPAGIEIQQVAKVLIIQSYGRFIDCLERSSLASDRNRPLDSAATRLDCQAQFNYDTFIGLAW
jgi:hypothetical protein